MDGYAVAVMVEQIERLKHELAEERAKRKEAEGAQAAMVGALEKAASTLDTLLGDSDLMGDDDSPEFQACQGANLALANLTPEAARMVRIVEAAEESEKRISEDREVAVHLGITAPRGPCDCDICKAVRGEGKQP